MMENVDGGQKVNRVLGVHGTKAYDYKKVCSPKKNRTTTPDEAASKTEYQPLKSVHCNIISTYQHCVFLRLARFFYSSMEEKPCAAHKSVL